MAGHGSKGAPATERVDVERVLSRRDQVVTLFGRDTESGGTWVIKELHLPVRPFPPADLKRSVWTRLVLPWRVEREGARTRMIRPFIEGTPLDGMIANGRLPLGTSLTVAIDSLRALEAIHQLGLVHGAVKPANVILEHRDAGWHAYVLDFGLARDASAPGLTETGTALGTPPYMSP